MKARGKTLVANLGERLSVMEAGVQSETSEASDEAMLTLSNSAVSDSGLRVDAMQKMTQDAQEIIRQIQEANQSRNQRLSQLVEKREESEKTLQLLLEQGERQEAKMADMNTTIDELRNYLNKFTPLVENWVAVKKQHVEETVEEELDEMYAKIRESVTRADGQLKTILDSHHDQIKVAQDKTAGLMDETIRELINQITLVEEKLAEKRGDIQEKARELAAQHEEVVSTLDSQLSYIEVGWDTTGKLTRGARKSLDRMKRVMMERGRTTLHHEMETATTELTAKVQTQSSA
jgi:DNA repair exonuclease SbcCD ATPase subunit